MDDWALWICGRVCWCIKNGLVWLSSQMMDNVTHRINKNQGVLEIWYLGRCLLQYTEKTPLTSGNCLAKAGFCLHNLQDEIFFLIAWMSDCLDQLTQSLFLSSVNISCCGFSPVSITLCVSVRCTKQTCAVFWVPVSGLHCIYWIYLNCWIDLRPKAGRNTALVKQDKLRDYQRLQKECSGSFHCIKLARSALPLWFLKIGCQLECILLRLFRHTQRFAALLFGRLLLMFWLWGKASQ